MQTNLVDSISFSINVTPVGKGRPRFNPFGQPYTPAATRKFEKLIRDKAKEVMVGKKPFGQDLDIYMRVHFYYAIPKSWSRKKKELFAHGPKLTKPDLSNLVKSVEDACNGVIYEDDKNISDLRIVKRYSDEDEIWVSIEAWSLS